MECDYLQGYLLGKPVAATQVPAFIPHQYLAGLVQPRLWHVQGNLRHGTKRADELVG